MKSLKHWLTDRCESWRLVTAIRLSESRCSSARPRPPRVVHLQKTIIEDKAVGSIGRAMTRFTVLRPAPSAHKESQRSEGIGSDRRFLGQNRNRKNGDKEKSSSNRANNHISSSEFRTEDSAKQLGTPRILVCPAEHPRQGPGELEAARPE
jgi:hypothetical protein